MQINKIFTKISEALQNVKICWYRNTFFVSLFVYYNLAMAQHPTNDCDS